MVGEANDIGLSIRGTRIKGGLTSHRYEKGSGRSNGKRRRGTIRRKDVLVGDLVIIGWEKDWVWVGIDLKRTDGLAYTVAAKNLATPVEMRVSPPSHTRTWVYLISFESYSRVE